jgi:acyl dehydratase
MVLRSIPARHWHRAAAAAAQVLPFPATTVSSCAPPAGLALAQVSRVLPNIVTVAGWYGCDHTGPVHEGDSLISTITLESCQPLPAGDGLAWLRIDVTAQAGPEGTPSPVLRWRCAVVMT